MNYLAHLYLSPEDDLSRLGNIMADFIRDVDQENLPSEVLAGIRLHQEVDAFTDSHPLIKELRRKFRPERRRFSGVVLDVVFDHFLIKQWSLFSVQDIDQFVDESYAALWRQRHWMPDRMELVMGWMISRDWIRSYSELENVGHALDGLASRLKQQHGFHGAVDEIEEMYTDIEAGFLEFFPQLNSHVEALKHHDNL